MSRPRYSVHGRRFQGSLAAPVRNESQSVERDDLGEAVRLAEDWSRHGMAVWVYEDRPASSCEPGFDPPHRSDGRYRVVAEWRPDGSRVR